MQKRNYNEFITDSFGLFLDALSYKSNMQGVLGVADKIYVISCSQDLASMGMDRTRTAIEGLEKSEVSMNWNKVQFIPIVATEKIAFQVGESAIVSIEPVSVPAFAGVFSSFYGANGMGFVSCIGALEFKPFSANRIADKAMFHSHLKAPVLPGDLLGQVVIVPGDKK